ncbi:hypothetical protein E5F05_18650 [Deinococcus metallilatus]|uniref:Nucleoside 2-deoxyribosyltransferase n=1 Tax=Deinococcus metallilatus TaxID=1211322 RepID=A0AAJ5F2L4_9DEIO|nr:hypothetical protein [Deinococcus metallilatus]MBB5296173.1 hypothetical protein [Deinococcus metallilatus]QBY09777.1 hypothetical protein E5F05_18650 [Deinococcus metallilatus]RXJ08975.1 hypothetical protein ERJ73_17485 [Deinococcus metallilatus]TLK23646.1 hypothetical protein FCS05_15595 [Deinococcus metallilatus]GMA14039.1 hypothetical protein GCM10025871_03700 [Deinococcus metallilatus]
MTTAPKTCFIIMAIGEQVHAGSIVTSADLRSRYDNLIKEAILKAYPGIDVIRADDVAVPGSISSDIVERIMSSDFVIADVTYPNPNVFYELGLRHASRIGTIIIRDRSGPMVPFDISHLRFIEYEDTTAGLRNLSVKLREYMAFVEKNQDKPDNHFLEIAKYKKHKFLDFSEETSEELEIITAFMQNPELFAVASRAGAGGEVDQMELLAAMQANPESAKQIAKIVARSNSASNQPNRQARRSAKKGR